MTEAKCKDRCYHNATGTMFEPDKGPLPGGLFVVDETDPWFARHFRLPNGELLKGAEKAPEPGISEKDERKKKFF